MRPLKKYNFPEALQKLRKYCAYQERCHQEVRKKLAEWGFDNEDKDKIIVQLMEEGFLNEERYAKAIVRGKLRQKGWGINKIKSTLKLKGISDYLINSSLKEIDDDFYLETLVRILEKKRTLLTKNEAPLTIKSKLSKYALGKGYNWEIISEAFIKIELDKSR